MKTKKITTKGCRNVQAVWTEEWGWAVVPIHIGQPCVFITKPFPLAEKKQKRKINRFFRSKFRQK